MEEQWNFALKRGVEHTVARLDQKFVLDAVCEADNNLSSR
nr:L746 [uncultured bacterium]